MNKVDLVEIVAERASLTKKEAEKAIDIFFEEAEKALIKGDAVKVSGFGSFAVRERAERNGVNPKNQETIVIPASRAVVFKPSKSLKEKVQ
ncbi:MAG: HU family DNA-binding protein [Bacilli bacterium]|jgi:DNA-binding protein HU-beta|nr:HU family DNA-binding protein [Bacilli bacterium]MCH4202081.1 HU family DNA-binding protein [Bacilli bacterium]MCH4235543.1 HU family DNA-binding protein [Bacilli bacterium]HMM00385.1 HU family DNA-binding protein [Bacilli bacterium]